MENRKSIRNSGPCWGASSRWGAPKPKPMPRRVQNPPLFKPLGVPKSSPEERARIELLRWQNRLPLWCGPAQPAAP